MLFLHRLRTNCVGKVAGKLTAREKFAWAYLLKSKDTTCLRQPDTFAATMIVARTEYVQGGRKHLVQVKYYSKIDVIPWDAIFNCWAAAQSKLKKRIEARLPATS